MDENGAYYLVGLHGSTPLSPHSSPSLASGSDHIGGPSHPSASLLVQSTVRGPVPVTLSSPLIIPGRTEVLVTFCLPKSSKDQLGMIAPIADDGSFPSNILAAYTVCQAQGCKVLTRLMNTSSCDVELQAGQRVSEFCSLVESFDSLLPTSLVNSEVSAQCSTSDNVFPPDYTLLYQELEDAISPALPASDKATLLHTLRAFADVFDDQLGYTDVIQHRIDTGSASPIRQYPCRLPFAYREEARNQVTEMLNQGVIQPSCSPWASPIVLVKKKDGKFRFCIDYRKLNAITKKDAHPLPRVDDLLDALNGSQYFSTLDLRSRYWQIGVAPEDREKTAFTTSDGLWEFVRLPFGVSGGPATFQRAIEIVLSGLTYDTCLCYFDDVIIPSSNLQQQCERLTTVLSRFRQHNLKVKASKCSFGASQVLFLGHIVSSQGVATDPKKTAAVSELSEPKNITELRAFLGLAGYYRRFIPNFASIASPLVELTKKGSKFVWSAKQHDGFQMLKFLLCKAPILAYPQLDHPFILQTDASDLGLGAVLTQLDSRGCERVISYASRSLSDREKAYSTTEKEALAVVFGTDHFRSYLLGRKFTIITDHSALRWLNSVELKGRLARWVLHLQEYSFDIQHRSGSSHGNADALSRLPLPNEEVSPSQSCYTTMIPGYNLQQAQIDDMHISKIIEME